MLISVFGVLMQQQIIKMKKTLTISLLVVVVIVPLGLGWYFLFPSSGVPVAEKIKDVLPFGSGDVSIPSQVSEEMEGVEEKLDSGEFVANLFRISNSPVSGMVAFQRNASTTIVRFVDRATGHIYDLNLLTFEKTKITNTTIPKIYNAVFAPNGSSVILQTLEGDSVVSTSHSLTPPKAASTTDLYTMTSVGLVRGIDELVTGQGNIIYYTLRNASGIISSSFSGGNTRTLYSSVFRDWRIVPFSNNLLVYTKANSTIPGYAYVLRNTGGGLSKILGPLNGLVVVPNSVGGYAYSYNNNGSYRFFVKHEQKAEEISFLPTIAEKCVWGKSKPYLIYCGIPEGGVGQNEPENWYQGKSKYFDRVWRLDARSEVAEVVAEPKKTVGVETDLINPLLTPNEDFLIFINKNDLSLWALKLD